MNGAGEGRGLGGVLNQRYQLLQKEIKGDVILATWKLVRSLLLGRPAAIGNPGKSFQWLEIPAVQLQNTSA